MTRATKTWNGITLKQMQNGFYTFQLNAGALSAMCAKTTDTLSLSHTHTPHNITRTPVYIQPNKIAMEYRSVESI